MRFGKAQRQPIAALLPLVMVTTRKAAHEVDATIADFRLLERLCHRWGWELGRIEFPAPYPQCGQPAFPPSRSNSIAILRRSSFAPPPCIMMLATASSRQS